MLRKGPLVPEYTGILRKPKEKERLNSDVLRAIPAISTSRTIASHLEYMKTKKTTAYGVGTQISGLGCGTKLWRAGL